MRISKKKNTVPLLIERVVFSTRVEAEVIHQLRLLAALDRRSVAQEFAWLVNAETERRQPDRSAKSVR